MTKPPDLRSDGPPKRLNVPSVDSVRKLKVFEGLADADIQAVLDAGTFVSVPAGWSLIWEKTPADKAYVILRGEVSVRRAGTEIARLGPGDTVGESAIVSRKLRNASVVSLTDLDVLHFTSEAVRELLDEVPAFREALEQTTRERLPQPSGS